MAFPIGRSSTLHTELMEDFSSWPTLAHSYARVHKRMLLMSLSLLLVQYSAYLACTWMVCEKGASGSTCFVGCCFLYAFLLVHVIHPYPSIRDTVTAWKSFLFYWIYPSMSRIFTSFFGNYDTAAEVCEQVY